MRFSVRPHFNPSGRYASADFYAEILPSGGLSVRLAFEPASPEQTAYFDAIKSGIAEYAADAPDDFGELPSACLTIERLDAHPTASDAIAFRLVGVFAAREFHKLHHASIPSEPKPE